MSPIRTLRRFQKIARPAVWWSTCPEKTALPPLPGGAVNVYQATVNGSTGTSITMSLVSPAVVTRASSLIEAMIRRSLGGGGVGLAAEPVSEPSEDSAGVGVAVAGAVAGVTVAE